jgi:hypothetical protein
MSSKDKDKEKKVGAISASDTTKAVKATEAVEDVEKVRATSAVSRVSGVKGVGATSGIGKISLEQRDKLMSMVSEEAAKLAAQGVIPKSQREIIEHAVKMVIDASLVASQEGEKKS